MIDPSIGISNLLLLHLLPSIRINLEFWLSNHKETGLLLSVGLAVADLDLGELNISTLNTWVVAIKYIKLNIPLDLLHGWL